MLKIAVKGKFQETCKAIRQITDGEIYDIDEKMPCYADIAVISEYTEKMPECKFIVSQCKTLHNIKGEPYVVTCGMDSCATLTISSYTDILYANIQCCIQRTIYTLRGNKTEQQEFSVEGSFGDINILLISIAVAIINDIDINIIKKRLLKSIDTE